MSETEFDLYDYRLFRHLNYVLILAGVAVIFYMAIGLIMILMGNYVGAPMVPDNPGFTGTYYPNGVPNPGQYFPGGVVP